MTRTNQMSGSFDAAAAEMLKTSISSDRTPDAGPDTDRPLRGLCPGCPAARYATGQTIRTMSGLSGMSACGQWVGG